MRPTPRRRPSRSGGWRALGLLLLAAALQLLLATTAAAQSCSAYKGQATLNELFIGRSNGSSSKNHFEVYNAGNVAASVWRTWKVQVYVPTLFGPLRMSSYALSSNVAANGAYLSNTGLLYLRNRNNSAVTVLLVDAQGAYIDMLSIEGAVLSRPGCLGTAASVNATASSDSSGDIARLPNGGALPAAVSNGNGHSIGLSNDCTQAGPDLVVNLAADVLNPIVATTTVTYTVSVSNKGCTSGVSNVVIGLSGLTAGTLNALSASASAGKVTTTASAMTWDVGSLNAGKGATLTVSGKPRSVGSLAATARVSSAGATLVNTADDSDTETVTVRDRNYIGFATAAVTLTEGQDSSHSAVIEASVQPGAKVTVHYSISGTGTALDTNLPVLGSGTVTIDPTDSANPTTASIDFNVRDDGTAEPSKAIRLTLTSVSSSDALVTLDPAASTQDITLLDDDSAGPHHLELRHASGVGLTCAPDAVTVVACQDAACSTPYTGGVTGTLGSSRLDTLWPATPVFSIPVGSSSTSVALQQPVAGSAVLGVVAALPAAADATACSFGSPGCTYTAEDAGLLASVADHVAGTVQTLSVRAVRKADNANVCVAALANVTRALTLRCSYVNPASGTLPLQVGTRALNGGNDAAGACDASGQLLSLSFDAQGSASTSLSYADAGQVDLSLSLLGGVATGDSGLALLGSSRFIAAPAALDFGALPGGPIRAGSAFTASVRALNALGAVTPNFGREAVPATVTLSHRRVQPSGAGAVDGVFSGSLGAFSAGVAPASNLVWSEVGRIDLLASHANYLGSAYSAVGTASAVGPFVPHHFDLTATPACGAFSYAGQPFAVAIAARNALGALTRNYDGSALTSPHFARAVTLGTVGGDATVAVANGEVAATRFAAGSASLTQASVDFAQKLTGPLSAALRVSDSDGVSSAGQTEPSMPLRSGRLVISNAFGDNRRALELPLQLQHWSGRSWVPNTADSCTVLPASAVARGTPVDARGAAASWTTAVEAIAFSGGIGSLRLAPPSPAGSGTVEVALNLGRGSADASCLGAHPASVGAGLPWLRARHGSCAASHDRDPSARATFGIWSPEARRAVHVRSVD